MSRLIFINLPVRDLDRSVAFYERMGAEKNPQFSDHTAACMVMSDVIHVMLLTHDKFRQFTPREIADAGRVTEVLLAISAESRDAVDGLVDAANGAGGRSDPAPVQDHGFMYCRSFEDPDGHIWEVAWMDLEAAMAAAPQTAA
jgi:predicted lactoylglutathione lyase